MSDVAAQSEKRFEGLYDATDERRTTSSDDRTFEPVCRQKAVLGAMVTLRGRWVERVKGTLQKAIGDRLRHSRVRRGLVVVAAAALVGIGLTAGPVSAGQADATSYTWVGASGGSGGDNASWTDPLNWSPQGVPHDGDSATVTSTADDCTVDVQGVPDEVSLVDFTLQAVMESGCSAEVQGGHITVTHSFGWAAGGILASSTTLAAGAVTLPEENTILELVAPFEVAGYVIMQDAIIKQVGTDATIDILPGGTMDGNATMTGDVTNAGTFNEDIWGVPGGYVIGGNFTQKRSGNIRILTNRPMTVTGEVTMKGTVFFDVNKSKHETPLTSGGPLRWHPSCTTSTGVHRHWQALVQHDHPGGTLVVNRVAGPPESC